MHNLFIVSWYKCFLQRDKRINKTHERSLRLILNYYESLFDSLLYTLNKKAIHQRCINVLLTKVYEYLNSYSPNLINEVFIYTQTTTTYAILMFLLLIIRVTNS